MGRSDTFPRPAGCIAHRRRPSCSAGLLGLLLLPLLMLPAGACERHLDGHHHQSSIDSNGELSGR